MKGVRARFVLSLFAGVGGFLLVGSFLEDALYGGVPWSTLWPVHAWQRLLSSAVLASIGVEHYLRRREETRGVS